MKRIKLFETLTADNYHYIIDMQIGFRFFPQVLVCYIFSYSNTLCIADICVGKRKSKRHINKGYGTLLMQKLIQYAKENNYNAITGTLVDKDADHRERQIHFYKKFGFEISEPNHNNECAIKFVLK